MAKRLLQTTEHCNGNQEPISRSVQMLHLRVTAFYQPCLFLDLSSQIHFPTGALLTGHRLSINVMQTGT